MLSRSCCLHLFHPIFWYTAIPVHMTIMLIGLFMVTSQSQGIKGSCKESNLPSVDPIPSLLSTYREHLSWGEEVPFRVQLEMEQHNEDESKREDERGSSQYREQLTLCFHILNWHGCWSCLLPS